MESYGIVIIGGGQAGIIMGYYLQKAGVPFIIVDESSRTGDSWRNRYNSLVLFTSRHYSSLPGLKMEGSMDGYPTKDEMADYLECYVQHFQIPVLHNTKVVNLSQNSDSSFIIKTNKGYINASKVIIATGAFQKPYIPPVLKDGKTDDLFHIHSSKYRSPIDVKGKAVLVVGGGNSGAQIAVELAKEKDVSIAINHSLKFLPLQFLGRSIFSWLETMGILYSDKDSLRGKWFQKQSDPILGSELKELLIDGKVRQKPTIISVKDKEVIFQDNSKQTFDNIVWSTGFIPEYSWISIEGVISPNGKPIHKRGITSAKGLFFLGLPWQYQRGSALICGVRLDATYLLPYLLK